MNLFKSKITESDITYGNTDPDEFDATFYAYDLYKQGYRGMSNAYCLVGRVDRTDWLEVLAKQRHCCVADFYNVDGSGVGDNHRDFYIRTFTKDTHTIHPRVYEKLKRL
jgi:hypothetical protein